MSEEPKREKDTLQAGNYTLGVADGATDADAPVLDFAKPVLTIVHHTLDARPLELQLIWDGDSADDQCAVQFFADRMRAYPNGMPGKNKEKHFADCREHLRAQSRKEIGDRRLCLVWARVINFTGAVAYSKPGPDTNS
jgi:hypothetical protein